MISVILPSFLGNYNRAAKNRDVKLVRAIESVAAQTYTDWQLIIIADGCDKTMQIVVDYLTGHPELSGKIHGYYIKRQAAWAGTPRNVGIDKAEGDIIAYLDGDDQFEPSHLQFIADGFAANPAAEWVYFDDKHPVGGTWQVNNCSIRHHGYCGTANIAHLRRLPARWPKVAQYGNDDWGFIRTLKNYAGAYIGHGGYLVCHYPNAFDI